MRHYLHIVVSVVSGIGCVVLLALWIGDYRNTRLIASLPYAFPTLITFGLTLAPWASGPTRFSLRTLFVLTTMACLALGAIIYFTPR